MKKLAYVCLGLGAVYGLKGAADSLFFGYNMQETMTTGIFFVLAAIAIQQLSTKKDTHTQF